jgi:hypothetical protein
VHTKEEVQRSLDDAGRRRSLFYRCPHVIVRHAQSRHKSSASSLPSATVSSSSTGGSLLRTHTFQRQQHLQQRQFHGIVPHNDQDRLIPSAYCDMRTMVRRRPAPKFWLSANVKPLLPASQQHRYKALSRSAEYRAGNSRIRWKEPNNINKKNHKSWKSKKTTKKKAQ